MIMATFFGVVFEGLFLVAWANFIKMDQMENDAFLLIQRCIIKKTMKE